MPTTIRLSESDRARVRHHLGYQNVEPVSSIALGFPSAQQPQFLVERSMDRLMPEGVGRILDQLNTLDCIENQMRDALCRLSAVRLGELQLRNNNNEQTEGDLLEREYLRWAKRLADDLGAPLNPFSARFEWGGDRTPVNVAVVS